MLLTVSPRKVSIHAPVKVRLYFLFQISYVFGFNSRTCEGATNDRNDLEVTIEVSIHAPVKVRQRGTRQLDAHQLFQFTHL